MADPHTLAQKLIKKFGTTVEIIYRRDTADVTEPWKKSKVASTSVALGVFLSLRQDIAGSFVDPAVPVETRRVIVAAADLAEAPTVKCELRSDSILWKITKVETFAPAGEAILYTLQVQR
jgi:hypothetical protein